MQKKEKLEILLFLASGAETLDIRDYISLKIAELNNAYEKSDFVFRVRRWEWESSSCNQDDYNKLADESEMVAIIIKNTLGKYTKEEFEYAVKLHEKNNKPKVSVFTLPTNADNKDRHKFIKILEKKNRYRFKVEDKKDLWIKISNDLKRIENDFTFELKSRVAETDETAVRLNLEKNDITKEAMQLYEQGNYLAALKALDIEKIRKEAKELTFKHKELAKAFILKAKLELVNVKNPARFSSAEKYFEKALSISRDGEILFEYAYYCQKQNQFKKSEELYCEALIFFRRNLIDNPEKIPAVANLLNNLAVLHDNINDYAKAEKEYLEALNIYRSLVVYNSNVFNPYVATILNNLAALHYNINDYAKAEKEYLEALKIRRSLAADNSDKYNQDVAMTLNNLAALHSDLNDYEKTEKEFLEALNIYRSLAADNPEAYNPYVATILNNLAVLHDKIYDYAKAEKEYLEALEIRRNLAADNPEAYNPDVAMTLNNLAVLHDKIYDYAKAEKEYLEALKIRRKLVAKNFDVYNSYVAKTLKDLANLYIKINELKKAEKLFREALRIITPYYNKYPDAHGELYETIISNLNEIKNKKDE